MQLNRFMWEDVEKGVFRKNKRIRTILKFENVVKVHSKNITQSKKDKFLDFLTIESNLMPDNNYEMKIVFAGDSILKVITEVIEVTLDDQGDAWETKKYAKTQGDIMLKFFNANQKNFLSKLEFILNTRKIKQNNQSLIVKKILKDVKKRGDKAVIKYEKRFLKLRGGITKIKFSRDEIKKISKNIDKELKRSIDLAYNRIKYFHSKQKFSSFKFKDKFKNELSYKYTPLESVGVYVPGGTASYPSSVLMNCIPALVAGVKNIYLTTPALKTKVNPAIIYAANKCGVKEIYKTGGAQSIAAFAFGTKTFKKVDKIVGPGNMFVATAKKEVFGEVGIDMVAGPSEVSIVADRSSNPNWIASDLIAQAEHDNFAQSILITNNKDFIKLVNLSIKEQLYHLPKKKLPQKV